MEDERRTISVRYCIIKGIVGYLMHISADKRLLQKDRRITQIVFFAVLTVFFAVGSTQFSEETVRIISLVMAAISLVLCVMFIIIFIKGRKNYLFAEDQIIDAVITEDEIRAKVNDKERVIPLDGSMSFTQNSEYYIFMDGFGGFVLPNEALSPEEKNLCDLWFSRGAKYIEPKLRGRERAPKMKF